MQLDDEDLVSPLGGDLELHRAEADVTPTPEEDPYEALQKQFKAVEEERETIKAEREAERQRADDLTNQLSQYQTSEVQNHKALIEQALVFTQNAVDAAKQRYAQARQAGDIDEELAATEALQDARDELKQLRLGHQQVSEAAKQPPAVADPIEHIISTQFKEPKDRDWLRLHRDDIFGADTKRKEMAILGDQVAALKGLKPGTDAYYEHMDAHMGYTADDSDMGDDATPAPPPPKKQTPAPVKGKRPASAPSARATGGKAGEGAPTAATPEVVALARDLGMTPAKYMEYMEGLKADKYPGYRLLR